ncbi:membrane protein [Streptococcus pneumoniae]|nr:membrane protein [Streptococcus pneumoniae]
MLFIYVSFYLLKDLVRWEKVLKVTAENARKVRLLVAFFSIVIGYILSSFFISLYHLWQEALRGLL